MALLWPGLSPPYTLQEKLRGRRATVTDRGAPDLGSRTGGVHPKHEPVATDAYGNFSIDQVCRQHDVQRRLSATRLPIDGKLSGLG